MIERLVGIRLAPFRLPDDAHSIAAPSYKISEQPFRRCLRLGAFSPLAAVAGSARVHSQVQIITLSFDLNSTDNLVTTTKYGTGAGATAGG